MCLDLINTYAGLHLPRRWTVGGLFRNAGFWVRCIDHSVVGILGLETNEWWGNLPINTNSTLIGNIDLCMLHIRTICYIIHELVLWKIRLPLLSLDESISRDVGRNVVLLYSAILLRRRGDLSVFKDSWRSNLELLRRSSSTLKSTVMSSGDACSPSCEGSKRLNGRKYIFSCYWIIELNNGWYHSRYLTDS